MQRRAGATSATILILLCGLAAPSAASADDRSPVVPPPTRSSPWAVRFGPEAADGGIVRPARLDRSAADLVAGVAPDLAWQERASGAASSAESGDQTARTTAFVYSDGYRLRRKIHYIASFATIPLFATQYALGRKLYDDPGSSGTRTAHRTVAVGIGTLFGINTVTGVWNLVEARKDPNGRAKRMAHGLLMFAADAGFAATAALGPRRNGSGNRSAHRAVALTSVALATTGYLIMLFGR